MPKTSAKTPEKITEILIKGARVHNLKNITVGIPRNKLVVVTGLSGSGKSSLAFDTLYAEGQRRYVESLSSYARQFLGRLDKPDVDLIENISPAIAIEQKVISRNSRSTVGTSTEIYDYLKLLFARIGKTISPVSRKEVKRDRVEDVIEDIEKLPEETRIILYTPILPTADRDIMQQLKVLELQGYVRIMIKDEVKKIEQIENTPKEDVFLVVDRFTANKSEENLSRIADSLETAFFEGHGDLYLMYEKDGKQKKLKYSNKFELDGITFTEPSVHFFSFNNPLGACKSCEGFGSVIGIDPDLVIPNKSLSVYDGAIVCWKGEKMGLWKDQLIMNAEKFDFPIHRPIHELTEEQEQLLWTGNEHFDGLDAFFKYVESKAYKIQYRVMLSRYRGKTKCPDCNGSRLRKDTNYVKISDTSIGELTNTSIANCSIFFEGLKLSKHDEAIASRILVEIKNRLQYLCDVGLGYLTLNRKSNTLSGGESQRINLATSLGSNLVGSMYILDEPSIGLHPHDTKKLISVIESLRDLGNTVIVVEHDEEMMKAADRIIDMGPGAGRNGGEVVFEGVHADLIYQEKSLTALYLTGKEEIPVPRKKRAWKDYIEVLGARENNLKNFDVKIPLGCLAVVTGVSGSGKTSLVKDILYPAVQRHLGNYADRVGEHTEVKGSLSRIGTVEFVDQNPIGKSSRSNPVTYVKAFDEIRTLFSKEQLSMIRGYKAAHFSFNVAGGRCETCEGEGTVTIEMQFMADITLECETCKGKRFSEEILEVEFQGMKISQILRSTVDEAVEFFSQTDNNYARKILNKLRPLQDVGLGYVQLGQASSTLSGGEAQRIKLASFLAKKEKQEKTLFIFDEPTTGLHFHDVRKLLDSLFALIDQGHSVIVIEHNTDVIKCADWMIDMGPVGGEEGGYVIFEGQPEDSPSEKRSLTGKYLKEKF
ncbi:MAG: excinuclease ABC subunit UvrA [Flavobacteriales bacterium]|nr:excinuclease ABC subunit UvrA [Flavobacteriales bacterium]